MLPAPRALLLGLGLSIASCGGAPSPVGPPPAGPGAETTGEPIAPDEPAEVEPAPAAEPAAAPAPASGPRSRSQILVDEHNRYRAKHCAPPLSWSPKLAASAQAWADHLRKAGCMFGHSSTDYGENLAAGTSGALSAESVVEMWYREVDAYDFRAADFSSRTGHFTQLVWAG